MRSEHSGTLQVGFWNWGTFNGAFDEVKIFDEALTPSQIIAEMAPPDTPDPSLETVRVLDFGQVPFGESASASIRMANTGASATLLLDSVRFADSDDFEVEAFPRRLEPGEVGEIRVRASPSFRAGQRHAILEIQSNDADEDLIRIAISVSADNQSGLTTHLTFDDGPSGRFLRNAAPFGDTALVDGELVFGQAGLHERTGDSVQFTNGLVRASDFLGDEITFALWLQPEIRSSEVQALCAAGGEREPAWALTLIDGKLAWFGGGNAREEPDWITDTPVFDPADPRPLHVAFAVKRGELTVDVQWLFNGIRQPDLALPGTDDSVGNLIYLGAFGKEVLAYRGAMDDVQIYNRALSPEEMSQLYENPGETLGTLGALDSDGDGLLDTAERAAQTQPLIPDTDADGLNDGQEIALGSNPLDRDSDGGGTWDGTEVIDGSDPHDPSDDLPIWTIHTIALRTPKALKDIPVDSTEGLDIFGEFTFQRRFVDLEDKKTPDLGVFEGGDDLDALGYTLRLHQIHYISGRIAVEEGGIQTLGVAHGSQFRLFVDGKVVAEYLQSGGARSTVAVELSPGVHEIELQAQRSRFLELFHWEKPGDFTNEPPFETAALLEADHVEDVDVDEDGLPDFWELSFAGNLNYGRNDDPDEDGLAMHAELAALTHPLKADTDGDGVHDAAELKAGTHPGLADSDQDGLSDGEERLAGTDPLTEDTDGDGLMDGV